MNAPGRLMRLPEVLDETGLSRATVYRWIKAGTFPRADDLSRPIAVFSARGRPIWRVAKSDAHARELVEALLSDWLARAGLGEMSNG